MIKKIMLILFGILLLALSFGAGAYGSRVYLERENAKYDRLEESTFVERLSLEVDEIASYAEQTIEAEKLPISLDVLDKRATRLKEEISQLSDGQVKKEALEQQLKQSLEAYTEKVKAAEQLAQQAKEQEALEQQKKDEALKTATEKRNLAERELEEALKREKEYKKHQSATTSTKEKESSKVREPEDSFFKFPKLFTKNQAKKEAKEWYLKKETDYHNDEIETSLVKTDSDEKGKFWQIKGYSTKKRESNREPLFNVKVYESGDIQE